MCLQGRICYGEKIKMMAAMATFWYTLAVPVAVFHLGPTDRIEVSLAIISGRLAHGPLGKAGTESTGGLFHGLSSRC